MERADLPDDYNLFEIGYCGRPAFTYAHIQLGKATNLILPHFQEEDHIFIYDTLNSKKTQLVCLYSIYRHKKMHLECIQQIMIKNLCICANIWRWIHWFSPSYDISCCVFLLKYTSKYVGGLQSYRDGLLWWLLCCCTMFQNEEGKWYYYLSFARFPMYHFKPNNIFTATLIA